MTGEKRNALYFEIIEKQRTRHVKTAGGWPGKPVGTPASSKYPNLLAELSASGRWLSSLADCAGVTPSIMAAVIENDEDLTIGEMRRVGHYFGCRMDYLAAPVLSLVDPAIGKGKCRIQRRR